jgi:acyl-coenzyme A synthetase/AMP-(fatty) acid ligase
MSTLEDLATRALTREPGLPAIEFNKRWVSWGEMRGVAEQVWRLLEASGADVKAPIVFAPRNRPSAVATFLALLAKGRAIRMVYAFQKPAGIARDIARLRPAIVLADTQDFTDEIKAILREQGIAAIALSEMNAAPLPGFERATAAVDPVLGAPQIEILTSGTTGPPKHFPIPYAMIVKYLLGANTLSTAQVEDYTQLAPMLLFSPLGNISGIYGFIPPMINGQRGVLVDRFTAEAWHDYVLRYRPSFAGMIPAGVQMVLDANIPPEDLSSIKALGVGAAPLDPGTHRAFEQRYGIPILLSYGATEFGGPVTSMTLELYPEWGEKKFGSVGRAFGGAKLRIVHPDTGVELPPGQEGLVEVMTPRMGDHWIRTADLAVIDADGFLFHHGRADGAIMRGGFKLLPESIEQALLRHGAISAAAVTGVPDKRLGQVPAAAIQLKPGAPAPSIPELEAHLRDHVLATHIPVYWRFVDALPRTPSMKVDRPALRQLFEAE